MAYETWERKLPGESRFVSIMLPTTKDDWELYDVAGATTAAKRLTGALKRACRRFDTLRKTSHAKPVDALSAAFTQVMDPVLNKWSKQGAADSEPYYRAVGLMRRYAVAALGGDEYDYDFN